MTVLALGDSCTFGFIAPSSENGLFVDHPYPEVLQTLLMAAGKRAEVINAGVCGYTSYHGLILLKTKLRGLEPDLITVQYRWNDLLSSVGLGRLREPRTELGRSAEDLFLRSALYRFGLRLATVVRRHTMLPAHPGAPAEWIPTVALKDYEDNTRWIVERGRARGAQVLLITSPHAFLTTEFQGREREFARSARAQLRLMRTGGIRTFNQLVGILNLYNESTRRLGAELAVPVLDLEAVYHDHADEHLFNAHDAIHPNQRGHQIEAEELLRMIVAGESTHA